MKTAEKKAARPDEVYRKQGGRYIPIGYQWRGFPMDGIWLVQDGKCSMTCMIGLKECVPIFALNYRIHMEELCSYLHKRFEERPRSRIEEAKACCDYFADIAAKQVEEKC